MSIAELLEQLSTLQKLDRRIQALEGELSDMPKELDAVKEDQAAVKARVDAAEAQVQAVLKKRRDLEMEVGKCEQNVVKFENDKLKVKTNAEFLAMNNQIDMEKEKRSGFEDLILETFEEEDAAKAQAATLKEEMGQIDQRVQERGAQIKTRIAEDEEEVARLRGEREAIAPRLDAPILRRYERMREMKGGVAVAGVAGGTCGGCFFTLPPQMVAEVRKQDKLHECEQCGRYLIWDGIGATA